MPLILESGESNPTDTWPVLRVVAHIAPGQHIRGMAVVDRPIFLRHLRLVASRHRRCHLRRVTAGPPNEVRRTVTVASIATSVEMVMRRFAKLRGLWCEVLWWPV